MASIKDHLENTFDDLGEAKLNKFKKKLCDRKEQPRVSKATVEKLMDGQDLADEMVSTFTSTNALLVSLEILRAIGSNELAKELEEKTGCGGEGGAPRGNASAPPAAPLEAASAPSAEHFIEENMVTLIKRVNNVDPILDHLLMKKVITIENYQKIRTMQTTQDKMRELMLGPINSAGAAGKDILYQALKQNETLLMKDLENN